MTLAELIDFRKFVNSYLKLISHAEKRSLSRSTRHRESASKLLDFSIPKFKSLAIYYIKYFCNDKNISSNNAYMTSIRVDILEKIRERMSLDLPKTYARMLKTHI